MFDFFNDLMASWPFACQVLMYLVSLAIGVFCLVRFCDVFVEGASGLAKRLKIPAIIIGLTVVAMGTSLPELAVSSADAIDCLTNPAAVNANVALGNVVGSNICNILLVLGLSVIFTPIIVKKDVLKKDYPIFIGVTLVMVIFTLLFNASDGNFSILRWEGIVMIVLMIGYIAFLIVDAKRNPADNNGEEVKDVKLWKAIIMVIIGAVGIIIGGELVVFGAKELAIGSATRIGLDKDLTEALVGLTIVAVGTSLPELVTSVVAAKKGENEIALGNVIGSNIFNILFVAGIASTIYPLQTGPQIAVDLVVMLGVSLLLFALSFKLKLAKPAGITFLTIYVLYVTYLILRTCNVIPMPGAAGLPAMSILILVECVLFGVFVLIYFIMIYKNKRNAVAPSQNTNETLAVEENPTAEDSKENNEE